MQHVYKARYAYHKRVDMNHMTYLMLGPGILWAEGTSRRTNPPSLQSEGILLSIGDMHQRHRKVMNPAFSAQQLLSFVPLFQRTAQKVRLHCSTADVMWCAHIHIHHHQVVAKWKAEVDERPGHVIMVNKWLTLASLDIVGEGALSSCIFLSTCFGSRQSFMILAAFGYKFGALDGEENALGTAISNVM